MNISPEEVQATIENVRKACSGIRAMPPKVAEAMISKAFVETNVTLKAVEDRIEEAGCIPGDVATIFLHYGAIAEVMEQLPAMNDRRELVAAGREIGKVIASKMGDLIREKLSEQQKGKGN